MMIFFFSFPQFYKSTYRKIQGTGMKLQKYDGEEEEETENII